VIEFTISYSKPDNGPSMKFITLTNNSMRHISSLLRRAIRDYTSRTSQSHT